MERLCQAAYYIVYWRVFIAIDVEDEIEIEKKNELIEKQKLLENFWIGYEFYGFFIEICQGLFISIEFYCSSMKECLRRRSFGIKGSLLSAHATLNDKCTEKLLI